MILLDTNVLGRLTDASDPHHLASRRAVHVLLARGDRPAVVPQNPYEFWAVATRKPGGPPTGRNGLGMTPSQAGQWVRFFRRRFAVLPDRPELTDRWLDLVERVGVSGFRSHDARLVAAMQTYGIDRLLTFNGTEFRDLPVVVVDPREPSHGPAA